MRYELTDLKVFLAVAATRSVSGGAEQVFMTAPSASYRLKNLEQAVGCLLFDRTSKGMVLTAAGVTVKEFADKIMGNVERLQSEVARHQAGVVGAIRLFANSSTLCALTPVLSGFLRNYPNVNIDLEERLSEETVKAVLNGDADVGLIAGPVDCQGLENIAYGEDELVFITPPLHPLQEEAYTSLANAISYDLVSAGRTTSNFKYLQSLAQSIGVTLRVRVHTPGFDAVIRCVRDGAGIALVPYSVAARDIASKEVACVRLYEPWAVRHQQVVTRSVKSLPDYAAHLVARIVDVKEAGDVPRMDIDQALFDSK